MPSPSWSEFKEKTGKFEKFLDEKKEYVRRNIQGFKDKHQTVDEIITTGVKFLPSPFDKIAEAVYKGSDGSDEQRLDKVKKYFEEIKRQGEGHYNEILENIRKNHEVLKNNLYQSYGLNWLPHGYFEHYKSKEEKDLEYWKNGFEFDLPAIKSNLELRRDRVVENIKERLESQNKLLILGESGTSKTTILKEILCNYFDREYLILYNWGTDEIKQGDQLVNFMGDLLSEGKKILVVVDNVHTERVAAIFYVMDQISNHILNSNIVFLLAARLPEFDLFVRDRLDQVQQGKESIRKFSKENDFKFPLEKFSEDEIKAFIRKYVQRGSEIEIKSLDLKSKIKITVYDEESIERLSALIIKETNCLPIMIKFYLFKQGLRTDVERRYENYLKNYPERMHTMLVCSLLDISNLQITDSLLENMNIIQHAYELRGTTLYNQEADKVWKTLHPRWDMELLSLLYNEDNKGILFRNKEHLKKAIQYLFNINNENTTNSVISMLYDVSSITIEGFKNVPIDLVENVLQNQMLDYLSNNTKSNLYATVIGTAFFRLKKYDNAINNYDKAIEIDPKNALGWNNKGTALNTQGRYEEAIHYYDRALEIDPEFADPWNGKGTALKFQGRYEEAIHYYDRALEIDPEYVDAWSNMGLAFSDLGRYEEAIFCFNRALEIDPNHGNAWNNMGLAFSDLGRYEEAIHYYDRAIEIDPNHAYRWDNKAIALAKLERYEEAIQHCDQAIKLDPKFANPWSNRGFALSRLGRYEEAIHCYNRAIEIDPKFANPWNGKGSALRDLGRYEEAIHCYNRAIELDPNNASAWYNIAISKNKMKYDIEEILSDLNKSIEIGGEAVLQYTRLDPGFEDISNNEKFKALVGTYPSRPKI